VDHIDVEVLKDLAERIYRTVHPFLGSRESGRKVGVGFGGDPTKFIDQLAERTAIEYLKEKEFSCILVGEECGVQKIGRNPKEYLVIDSVDGTTNAVRGINFASASLAVASRNRLKDIKAAAVINLFRGDLYVAEKGEGAKCNGKEITPSTTTALEESIVSVDISSTPEMLNLVIPIMRASKRIRSLGAASLEIDFAAAMLILGESGGVFGVLGTDGNEEIPLTKLGRFSIVAAANKNLYDKIISLIPIS